MEQQEFLFIASGKGGLYSYSGKQFGSFLQSKQTFTKWSRNHVGLKTYVHTKSAHEYIIFFSQSSKSGSNHNHNGLKKKKVVAHSHNEILLNKKKKTNQTTERHGRILKTHC